MLLPGLINGMGEKAETVIDEINSREKANECRYGPCLATDLNKTMTKNKTFRENFKMN